MHEDATWSGERTPKCIPTKGFCHQYSEMACQFLQKIAQSPASWNERIRITTTWRSGIIDAQMKKFGIWRHPSEKNEVGKFLSTAAKNAGLHREVEKVAHHSVRKTSTSRLLDADVPENFVAQLSGHKSTESLQSYKSACAKHQKRKSLTLSRADLSGSRDEALLSVHNQGLLWSTNWLDLSSDSRASRYGRFNLVCPFYNRETEGGRTFKVRGAKLWNKIPLDMRKKDTAGAFKNVLKKYFLA